MARGDPQSKQDAHYDSNFYRRYRTTSARSDEELRDDIRDHLIRDERVDASQIEVAVASGIAALHGEVATLAEKRVAGEDALDTAGVADVSNLLRVREPAPAGR